MSDATNVFGTFETPADIANRPTTSFGWGGPNTIADIRFALVEGYRPLLMDLHLPPDAQGPVPVVVSIHGGGWLLGSQKIDSDDMLTIAAMWQALLDRGIAVASVQYRLSREAPFPAALHDVRSAVRWLRTFGAEVGVDPDRIAAFGDSAGGHLATFLAADATALGSERAVGVVTGSHDVVAAVGWYPVTEFHSLTSETYDWSPPDSMAALFIGGPLYQSPELARVASPISYVNSQSAPVLLQHGDQDGLVPYQQSVALGHRYREVGASAVVELVVGGDHGFDGADVSPVISRAADFLEHHLSVAAAGQ